ncbi:MAG: hypothetical protein KDB32_08335 [Planctomycetes bacterium]|nr:hypothetical protein [Planctomycetota bacterium]MCA8947290.1 hypothetical protein [Planctomycetota bacterium]
MRGLCVIVLALLAGCAATDTRENGDEQPALWKGEGLVYETTRGSPLIPEPGTYAADLTLVELDADVAAELLGIEEATDIAPRSFRNAMGEIAAVNACYGHGRLITRPNVTLKPGEATSWKWSVTHEYLQDWDGDMSTPIFGALEEGVSAQITVQVVDEAFAIKLETTSSQLASPMADFTAGNTGQAVKIQIPELSVIQRVATETVRVGETAMFQLSRAGSRVRLLFVRLNVAPA